jgi:hypothetical protein
MLPPGELDVVKEQFAKLKELCRLRTVRQIKEAQVSAMETYLEQLGLRKQDLQADMEAIQVGRPQGRGCGCVTRAQNSGAAECCSHDFGIIDPQIHS